MAKTKECKACGTELYKGAKICPKCGKKQAGKGKFILIAVIVIVLIGILAGGGDDESTQQTADGQKSDSVVYTEYNLGDMFEELESNAMAAEEKYTDAYVEITGDLSVIDSDGSYISVEPDNGEFYMISMSCYFQDDDQRQVIMEKSVGDEVTVKGQISDVGEIMGYSLDIDDIE